tara:strand:- start:976 stop:1962 length:987 start_codon:yes stop_codon:yes gene_type:complete
MPQIILLTGLPRSGKTLLKNLLSLNDDVQVTEKEFFFFRYFDDESFSKRGDYKDNLNFLFEKCKIAENLKLDFKSFKKDGENNKHLYLNIVENFFRNTGSNKKIFLDNSPDTIGYFRKYYNWLGDDFKCIYVKRNIIDNFASYKGKNINNSKLDDLIYNFQFKYHHSNLIYNLLKNQYPNNLIKVKFEDLIANTNETCESLIKFLNIPKDNEYYKKISSSKFKINSSFNKDRSSREIDQSVLNRSNHLNFDEKNKINQKLFIIDTSFYTKEVFDLDLKMKSYFIDSKKKNLKNLINYLLKDLKFFNILKIFNYLILFLIKKLFNKFFN